MPHDGGHLSVETAMPSATADASILQGIADPLFVNAVASAVENALLMCNTQAKCAGISRIPTNESGNVTGIIGVHGDVSGFVTVNMAERVALASVGGLLQEPFPSLCHQVVDGVGEITNIVAGGIKNGLAGTPWAFRSVTVPSVIIGQNYHIAYARGLHYLAVVFEHESTDSLMAHDRLFQVTLSLLRL